MKKARESLLAVLLTVLICLVIPISALGADKLVVKNGDGTTTFKMTDTGGTTIASRLYTNGASGLGAAPMVLGQPACLDKALCFIPPRYQGFAQVFSGSSSSLSTSSPPVFSISLTSPSITIPGTK